MTDGPVRLETLREIVGREHVLDSQADRLYYSSDLGFEPLEIAEFVVQPGTVEELAAIVRFAHQSGLAVAARGGGLSYTRGYTPARSDTVLIDMRRLDRVLEVNVSDLYVVVECGCTWETLHNTLRAHGVRGAFWGPASGRYATVGGTLSQNGLYYGSSRHGTLADCTLGLDIVLADGSVLPTGSGARRPGSPFFRYYGPDLTGLFLSDTGALGVKARAVLALVPLPEVTHAVSFAFDELSESIEAMREMARLALAAELFGLEPFHHRVAASQGFPALAQERWTLHAVVDGPDEALVEAALALLRSIGLRHGREITPDYALAARLDPFGAIRALMLGPEGEIVLPTHCIAPFSQAQEIAQATQDLIAAHEAEFEKHGVTTSLLIFATGKDFLLEPNLYWHDELGRIRLERIEPEYAARWGAFAADPQARAVALAFRRELVALYSRMGAVNIQIGKYYEFESVLDPVAWNSLVAIKGALDPTGVANPGALGLSPG